MVTQTRLDISEDHSLHLEVAGSVDTYLAVTHFYPVPQYMKSKFGLFVFNTNKNIYSRVNLWPRLPVGYWKWWWWEWPTADSGSLGYSGHGHQ